MTQRCKLSAGLFLASALFGTAVLCAQTPATPGVSKLAFLDVDRAVVSTQEGKKNLDEFQKAYEAKAKEVQDKQDALNKAMNEFQAQQVTLSDEKREERQSQLDEQTTGLNRLKEDHQKFLERRRAQIINAILGKMQPIIADYAKKNTFTAVFVIQQQMLAFVDPASDITSEIIKLYDTANPVKP
jgi:outer membrane protein